MKVEILVCDICKESVKNVKTYTFPSYEEVSVHGNGFHKPLSVRFEGEITTESYDLCENCAKKFFKDNVIFMLKKSIDETKRPIGSLNIEYEDEE